MNIVRRELWAHAKLLLYWSLSMSAFVWMMFFEFAAYYKNPEMVQLIEAMPAEMLAAFGMQYANLTTVSGYLSVTVPFLNLALGIYALLLGNNIIAKEERDKTAGFLMTLPVTRPKVVSCKLIAAVISCIILLAVVVGSILVFTLPYEVESEFPRFLLLVTASTFVFKLIFLSVGMLMAAATRRYKLSGGLGVGVIFALYLASVLTGLSESLAFLKYITPFSYFAAPQLLQALGFAPVFLVVSAVIIVSSLVGTYLMYGRRDLYV
ncbi:MAG: ABC transporter permease subunit [Peptococcaceae bacterium]|nr:ABC transporter permease subunit [Peptococcaceae bacterium]